MARKAKQVPTVMQKLMHGMALNQGGCALFDSNEVDG
jgi:hypothetical protein